MSSLRLWERGSILQNCSSGQTRPVKSCPQTELGRGILAFGLSSPAFSWSDAEQGWIPKKRFQQRPVCLRTLLLIAMTKYWQTSLKEERVYLGLGLKVQPIVVGEEGRRSVRQLITLYSQSERERGLALLLGISVHRMALPKFGWTFPH